MLVLRQSDPFEYVGDSTAGFLASDAIEFQGHLHVLTHGKAVQQVMRLEYVADLPAHLDQCSLTRVEQLLAQHAHTALLRRAQRTDEREQCGLTGARRPGQYDDLAAFDLRGDVEQHLLGEDTFAVDVRYAVESDRCATVHQNTSAGSAARTTMSPCWVV